MEENVTLLAAFGAGLLSFISPCVLPLIPGYLSYISGLSLEEMRGVPVVASGAHCRRGAVEVRDVRSCSSSLAFIIGFSLVFISLGAASSAVGQFLWRSSSRCSTASPAPSSSSSACTRWACCASSGSTRRSGSRPPPAGGLSRRRARGLAFAFGWTPCIGPILAGILAIAGSQTRSARGSGCWRLLAWTRRALHGDGVDDQPLLRRTARIGRHYHTIELVSGALLVVIGMLIFTNRFTVIAQWLSPYLARLLRGSA